MKSLSIGIFTALFSISSGLALADCIMVPYGSFSGEVAHPTKAEEKCRVSFEVVDADPKAEYPVLAVSKRRYECAEKVWETPQFVARYQPRAYFNWADLDVEGERKGVVLDKTLVVENLGGENHDYLRLETDLDTGDLFLSEVLTNSEDWTTFHGVAKRQD